ncbi:MAG: hypothetical protein AB8B57_15305 [Congregibacter sp.]
MADVTPLRRDSTGNSKAIRQRRRRDNALSLRVATSPRRAGFSARLNMLCGLAGERDLSEGRLDDLTALVDQWEAGQVQSWLTDDIVPGVQDLDLLVRFLTSSLPSPADNRHWEAFLLYGADHVDNPLHDLLAPQNKALLELASRTLLQITRDYRIPPHSYDADMILREITQVLRDLNISAADTAIQPGHRLMLANRLFPDYMPR